MVNFQSSIDELQREYNRNYTKLEGLERYYEDNKPWKKNKIALEVSYKIEKRKLEIRNQIIKKVSNLYKMNNDKFKNYLVNITLIIRWKLVRMKNCVIVRNKQKEV